MDKKTYLFVLAGCLLCAAIVIFAIICNEYGLATGYSVILAGLFIPSTYKFIKHKSWKHTT